jgi:glycosyltransferase involved in cell wall biosynthesis
VKDILPKITIVVPFRNVQGQDHSEGLRFEIFLNSLKSISGWVQEVILVNDHSTDNSLERINSFKEFNWKVLSLTREEFGKKAALELGIQEAKTEYIWTLDSDVEILNLSTSRFEKFQSELREDLVILPVKMKSGRSVLEILQCNEWKYMQFLTWLSARMQMPMMCNGANLIFKRSVFLANIESHRLISSGDDLFLLAETMRSKGEIGLLWSGFVDVVISPVTSMNQTVSQRLRWAGKTTKIPATKSSILHLSFALFSAVHVLAILGSIFSSFHEICLIFLLVKICFEAIGIRSVFSDRFGWKEVLVLIPQLLLYPFFSLSIFISSLFFIPKWKERRVSLK